MSSLIIKITQNGSSREYLFNRPGPIVIGSDQRCDLWLDDPEMEPRLLEVKVSGGKIFIKELGARSEIYLNSVILPYRMETPYHEGEVIGLKNSSYQIHIHKQAEAVEPPPFFEGEFKSKLDRLTAQIKESDHELKRLSGLEEKKQGQIRDLEDRYHHFNQEKARLEVEVESLGARKIKLNDEIQQGTVYRQQQEERELLLNNHIGKLESEERTLKETILATNQSLSRLKDEREARNKEMDEQRVIISRLESEVVQLDIKLDELKRDLAGSEIEIQTENQRLQKILKESETAGNTLLKERQALQKMLQERASLDQEMDDQSGRLKELNEVKRKVEGEVQGLKMQILHEESRHQEILEKIQRHSVEEAQLEELNSELRVELDKAENKLKLKKDQFHQADFQCQDVMRKLTTANFELERVGHHLKELVGEEEAHNLKIHSLREEIQNLNKKAHEERKGIQRAAEEERQRVQNELRAIEHALVERQREMADLEENLKSVSLRRDEAEASQRVFMVQRKEFEAQVTRLESEKSLASREVQLLKNETLRLQQEKGRIEKELALLNIKLLDVENQIKVREEEARLVLEDHKREERSRMLAEKEVLLAEVEAFKQKSLIEVDMAFHKQQDEIHQLKLSAHHEADDIIKEARERLRVATDEAVEREHQSHERIKAAQDYFKQKEAEADAIIQRSRLEARDLLKKTEGELLEDLARRKQKIKKFLSMKQEQGQQHLKMLEEQSILRMKKYEQKGHEQIEHLKRKELKKIARLREEELMRQHEVRDQAMKEVHSEKERAIRQISSMRTQQENELSETRRKVLEHINQIKFSQQSAWDEELKAQKHQFEVTKKARIENATNAIMNLLSTEFGYADGEGVKEKIQDTLKMAIDGQNAEGLKHVGQILDINPMMRKKMMPVLKKYTVRFGVPAMIALVMLADIGSLRTRLVDYSKDLMKLKNSASDIFVQQQKEAWKEKYNFNPPTTLGYKPTFTDNVLYTSNFEAVMDDELFQNDWILKVHDFMVKELELSEDVAINYISAEGTVIKELAQLKKEITPQFKDQGIAKMTAAEETHMAWLKEKLVDPVKAQKFADFRKKVFDDFHGQKFNGQGARDVAGESPKAE